jgi:hypothetical protein
VLIDGIPQQGSVSEAIKAQDVVSGRKTFPSLSTFLTQSDFLKNLA